jgi:hypothetical protein
MAEQIVQSDIDTQSQKLLARVTETLPQMQQNAHAPDRESEFPTSGVEKLTENGALGAVVPFRYGDLGMGTEPRGARILFDLLRLIGSGNLAARRIFEGYVNVLALALYRPRKIKSHRLRATLFRASCSPFGIPSLLKITYYRIGIER